MTYAFGIFRRSKRGAHRAAKRIAHCYGEHLPARRSGRRRGACDGEMCQTRKS